MVPKKLDHEPCSLLVAFVQAENLGIVLKEYGEPTRYYLGAEVGNKTGGVDAMAKNNRRYDVSPGSFLPQGGQSGSPFGFSTHNHPGTNIKAFTIRIFLAPLPREEKGFLLEMSQTCSFMEPSSRLARIMK